jgi:hypothetical protein
MAQFALVWTEQTDARVVDLTATEITSGETGSSKAGTENSEDEIQHE